jgi:hypothetical protein
MSPIDTGDSHLAMHGFRNACAFPPFSMDRGMPEQSMLEQNVLSSHQSEGKFHLPICGKKTKTKFPFDAQQAFGWCS